MNAVCDPVRSTSSASRGCWPSAALLQGRDSPQRVRPITTGIKPVDRMGIMEILWYTRQLKRIAEGGNPRANESGLAAFLKSLVSTQWGTYKTRRLRA
jgi:hypothetical protein